MKRLLALALCAMMTISLCACGDSAANGGGSAAAGATGEAAAEACEVLKKAEGYIKTELAHTMNIRKIPALEFVPDDSVDYYNRIDSILKGLKHDEGTDDPADSATSDGDGQNTDPDA